MKVATCPTCRRTRVAVRVPLGAGKGSRHIIRAHGCAGDRAPATDVRDATFRPRPRA